ncbi:hypothetical protein NQ315_003727 [Exocentrus adspersus]|uniref:Uncharacterized protein n=1 Tax=Exocentrus adspersus TaxID=1586481 RepID=A0AAV8VHY2_9CUCU|nr:hypothetical protein NQ315_003727 [Exocentrus adspersus]
MVTMKHEMTRINSDLFKKEEELEMEHDKNQHLLTKLKKLDNQKSLLSKQLVHLQQLLEYYDSKQCNEEEREAIANLHKQIEQQKREWEEQKASLGKEKEKAVQAARFATQKLLDTVTDFQRQVDTQKKVQNMLTKMVHDKEEELTIIKSKIFSINSITSDLETGGTLKEIFRRTNGLALSNPATSSSLYSCCSNCSKTACYKV